MTVTVVVCLLWGAAVYRIVLSARQPLTVWRSALTVAVAMAALSITLWAWRRAIDDLLGVPNLTNLLYHGTTLAGLVSVLIYDESLRHDMLPRRLVLIHISTGVVTGLTMTLAWVAAPIHDRFHSDLAPMSTLASVALYSGVFYLFMVWALGRKAMLCFTQGLRRKDPARTISLVLNGCACGLGALISGLWVSAVALRFGTNLDSTTLSRLGDRLLPAALILLASGILAMFVVPWVLDVVRSYLRLRALRPTWRVLTDLYPEVRLPTARVWGLRTWLETRERRTTIETADALRLQRLQQTSTLHTSATGTAPTRSTGRRVDSDDASSPRPAHHTTGSA